MTWAAFIGGVVVGLLLRSSSSRRRAETIDSAWMLSALRSGK